MTKKDSDTRIDLGDDLLEKTATLHTENSGVANVVSQDPTVEIPTESPLTYPREGVLELLENAKIYLNEGLVEEAKRIFRRILISDPHHLLARTRLEEIQNKELKQILGEESSARSNRRRKRTRALQSSGAESTETVLESLEKEMSGDRASSLADIWSEEELFPDQIAVAQFVGDLERQLNGGSASDRADLGVAFLVMGFPQVAARLFQRAQTDPDCAIMAVGMEAESWLQTKRPLDAIRAIGTRVHEPDLQMDEKLNLLYLMGRAHEQLTRAEGAVYWYQQIKQIAPAYRDVESRLRSLELKR